MFSVKTPKQQETLTEQSSDTEAPFDECIEGDDSRPGQRTVASNPRKVASRDEMNLAEFPLAVLSTRSTPGVKTLEFSDTQKLRNGEILERQWIITGADKFGLPTSTDEDVVLGLICLTMDQGFRDRKVYFTRYELLKVLRWTTEGRSYSRLGRSLDRLSGVRIRATNAFFDNTAKNYQTCNFGIIDAYELNDERSKSVSGRTKAAAEPTKSFFIWSELLFDSFKAGFIKKIDLDLYFTLNSAVSRRLYRYLDKHFYFKPSVERPLITFAFEKLGLSRTYKYVSSIKQQIEPAAEELVRRGFLGSFEFAGKGENTVVRFSRYGASTTSYAGLPQNGAAANAHEPGASLALTPGAALPPGASTVSDPQEALRKRLAAALVSRGILQRQTGRLLGEKSAQELERIERIISYFDRLVAAKDVKVSKNSIGFLYRAVEAPHRFHLPQDLTKQSAQPRKASRPELRVVKAQAASDGPDTERESALRVLYDEFRRREAERIRNEMSTAELAMLCASATERMNCLKNLLTAERFSAAVEAALRDDLCKSGKIPVFEEWLRSRGLAGRAGNVCPVSTRSYQAGRRS